MAETEQLKIQIVLDNGQVQSGFIDIEKQAKKSSGNIGSSFDNAFGGLASSIKGIGVAIAAAFTVNKISTYLKESANAAIEAEKAINALSASLAQIGKFSKESVNDFESYAQQIQATTGISDDLVIQNAALLASIGKLSDEGLKTATRASIDLATALQVDVGTGFDLVAKAASGNAGALGRYGIKIDTTIPKAEQFAAVLKLIQDRFGGLGETRLNTLEGALTNLSNSFGEVQKSIGKFITDSPAIRTILNEIAKSFISLSQAIDTIKGNNGDSFKSIIIGILQFARVVNEYLVKPLELGFNLLGTGLRGVVFIINTLIANFFQVNTAINKYLLEPLINAFGFIAEKIVSLVDESLGKKIGASVNQFGAQLRQTAEQMEAGPVALMNQSFASLSQSADDAFKSKIGGSIDAYLSKLQSAVGESKQLTDQFKNGTSASLGEVSDSWKKLNADINAALKNGIMAGVSQGISSIGASLVKGENAFDNFGKTILGILGDFSIQVGTLLVGIGLGLDTLKVSLATFNGAAVAAAGVGLIILGGALKALSGGLGSSSSGSPSGGGIASSPSPTTELTPTESLTRAEAQSSVSVVIQGDVLDSDESGSRIVSLINEAFNKKGVVINQGVMA